MARDSDARVPFSLDKSRSPTPTFSRRTMAIVDRPTTWIAAVALLGIAISLFVFRGADDPGTPLPNVTLDRAIPLVLRVDDARVTGQGPKDVIGKPYADKIVRNLDEDWLTIAMPLPGEVVFENVRIPNDARLHFGVGIEAVHDASIEGRTITFSMAVDVDEHREERRRTNVTIGAKGSAPTHQEASPVDLSDLAGRTIDLAFALESEDSVSFGGVVPVLLSPIVRSSGRTVRVDEEPIEHTEVFVDLLQRYEQARKDPKLAPSVTLPPPLEGKASEEIVARYPGPNGTLETITMGEVEGLDLAFGAGTHSERDVWPAIAFARDGEVARFEVDVPAAGATLEVRTGVDVRTAGVGATRYLVRVNDVVKLDVRHDPRSRRELDGWHLHHVDLAEHAGRTVTIQLYGTVENRDPVVTGRPPMQLELRRVRGGFGRPRVVREHRVTRRTSSPQQPSVIFVNVETLRADALSCYGSQVCETPNIDALASSGIRFERFVSAAPWTSPSVATTLTGQYPSVHGIYQAGHFLRDGFATLPERAQEYGVTTVGIVTNHLLSRRKNFSQGFEEYVDVNMNNARQVFTLFEDWLEGHEELQFLAFLHLFDPHYPYCAPGSDRERYVEEDLRGRDLEAALAHCVQKRARGEFVQVDEEATRYLHGRYHGEVHYLDRAVQRLVEMIERRGLRDRVVIVFTADHGETLGEHGTVGHGNQVYHESVRVPLILSGPGLPAAVTLPYPADNASLLATCLNLLRVPYLWDDVRPALELERRDERGFAYSATEAWIPKGGSELELIYRARFALRTATHALILDSEPDRPDAYDQLALYDLVRDPSETVDVSTQDPSTVEVLKTILLDQAQPRGTFDRWAGLDDETTRRLKALGYVGGKVPQEMGPRRK